MKKSAYNLLHATMRILALMLCLSSSFAGPMRNVILCIGDGMGTEHIDAAGYYSGTNLFFEAFPHQSMMTTQSANNPVTDSAASSTAMATGTKVNNTVVSVKLPGDGSDLPTMLEYFKARGKSTGLVATSYITHATPAAFGAHANSRYSISTIASDYLTQTKPNILFGGGANGLTPASAASAGYTIVSNSTELFALDTDAETFVSGQFGSDDLPYEAEGLGALPHLHEMTEVALDILDNDPDGFFLMVEGSLIDDASHKNNITNMIHETIEFAHTVESVFNWMDGRTDTLLLVVSDHETGGLTVTNDNGAGNYPDVTWSTTDHTSAQVPLYATGLNAHLATNIVDNTNVYAVCTSSTAVPELCLSATFNTSAFHMVWTSSSGDVYRLEHTFDLGESDWQTVDTFASMSNRVSLIVTNLPPTNAVMYRMISL